MRIYVCPCTDKEKSVKALPPVIAALTGNGITPVMSDAVRGIYDDERVTYIGTVAGDELPDDCDMIMTVGGDGTMLKWGKRATFAFRPLIGVNTGRLGFMTSLDADELDRLSALADGSYTLSRRMLLSASVGQREWCAINDVVLFKDVNSKLPEFTVKINGNTITKIRADGLIFSTPTGSTAYALSAGGPIIEPTVECIQMIPLCAHTLLNRPMIFSGNDIVTVSYAAYEGSRVNISADGSEGYEFAAETELTVQKLKDAALQIVEIGGRSFYSSVREKLMTPLK